MIVKYFVGNTEDKNEIDRLKNELVNKGFEDAFVVAFYKGLQISVKEALNLQKKIFGHVHKWNCIQKQKKKNSLKYLN